MILNCIYIWCISNYQPNASMPNFVLIVRINESLTLKTQVNYSFDMLKYEKTWTKLLIWKTKEHTQSNLLINLVFKIKIKFITIVSMALLLFYKL